MTHLPKNPYCPSCQRAKMQRRHHRRRFNRSKDDQRELPKAFGDRLTFDHLIAHGENNMGLENSEAAVACLDVGTGYRGLSPTGGKSEIEARGALVDFVGPNHAKIVKSVFSDNSQELLGAFRWLAWPKETSTPGDPGSNPLAERNVRHIKEGAKAVLDFAGHPPSFWPWAGPYFCHSCNITVFEEGKATAWEKRHGQGAFPGPHIPYGATVDYLPPPYYRKKQPTFSTNAIPGIFLGYKLHAGGKWKK